MSTESASMDFSSLCNYLVQNFLNDEKLQTEDITITSGGGGFLYTGIYLSTINAHPQIHFVLVNIGDGIKVAVINMIDSSDVLAIDRDDEDKFYEVNLSHSEENLINKILHMINKHFSW